MCMDSGLVPLIDSSTSIKVSSTLDKSVGKQNLVDGNIETCWTSQQGLPQSIRLSFPNPIIPRRVSFVFQGGFVGTHCSVQIPLADDSIKEWQPFMTIYPEDVNSRQTFDLPGTSISGIKAIKFIFEQSSDIFGRITVYDLRIEGILVTTPEEASQTQNNEFEL